MADRPVRRSQAERSAATRARTIEVAITCLSRDGYGATSLQSVANEAKLTRGAMSHQFPSKADLMIALVETVYQSDARAYAARSGMPPAAALENLPKLIWQRMSRPSGVAVIEIMVASRSDPELGQRMQAMQSRWDERIYGYIVALMDEAGLVSEFGRTEISRVLLAAMRGLAVERMFMGHSKEIDAALQALWGIGPSLYRLESTD